jgi:hypothetical protein
MSEQHSTDFARQLELAWAAGFFDGEGSTSPHRDKTGYCIVQMSIGQVEREPLDRFMKVVGGKIYGPRAHKNRFGSRPQYRWKADGIGARAILGLLWPYLTEVKRSQAAAVFAQDNSSGRPKSQHRTHCPKGHDYDYVRPNGNRGCRQCSREQRKASQQRKRERDQQCPPTAVPPLGPSATLFS